MPLRMHHLDDLSQSEVRRKSDMVQKMKFLDLFAGIGGFRIGMESAGHECIGFCEIDKFARASYKAIHDTKGEIELHDITTVSDDTIRGIGHVDVDFRAKLSLLQEQDEDLKIQEELSSLKLQGSHLFSNPDIYSLKTSRDSSTTTEEIPLRSSSQRWMNWGMMWNGKCLTAKILESPKIGNVCSLSDILEEEVDERYFLSAEKISQLVTNQS
ncbi:type II DNA modification methyltransferase [Streptococcus pneumoniae]|nr:type II DNA modification methyltransferase [Streptococcus pneumoniae]